MIRIEHVAKSFDGKPVLEDVSLHIPEGKTVVIIGRSGCGKTVLLKAIIGLIRPDGGKIIVDGEDISRLDRKGLFRLRRNCGMLFQGAALFDSMTVFENIALPLKEHTEFDSNEIGRRVRDMLETVGLSGIEEKKPAELSGGMRKRVGLARALIMNPKILLYDEPTTGLDPVTADSINDLIIETSQREKITSVAVTHDLISATKIGHSIAMLHQGRVVFEGTPKQLQQARSPILKEFIHTFSLHL